MIRNEVCCDVCGKVVAEIEPGIFKRKSVVRRYLTCKGAQYSRDEKFKAHICFDCIYEIRRAVEEKEQAK